MGLIDKAKEVLNTAMGKEEVKEKTTTQIKQEVANIRAASEDLKNQLLAVRFKDNTGKIPPEKMKHYVRVLSALTVTLDKTPAYELDTRALDQRMEELTRILTEAIRDGHEDTADRTLKALLYGIGKGHAGVTTTDQAKIDKQLQDRLERLEQYCTIVDLSRKVDHCNSQMEQAYHMYQEISAMYSEKRAALAKEEAENPFIFERVKSFKGRNEARDPEEMDLVARMREVTDLALRAKQLKQQRTTNMAEITGFNNQIQSEESMLMMQNTTLEDELIAKIEQDVVNFRERMSDAWAQIYKLGEMSDQTDFALNAIFSSAQIDGYVIDTVDRYEEIKRQEKRKEEGRRMALEKAQEKAQENAQEAQENAEDNLLSNY